MKTKRLHKKLILNKTTISDLHLSEMNRVNGGIKTGYSCPPKGCDTDLTCEITVCGLECPTKVYTECYSQCIC